MEEQRDNSDLAPTATPVPHSSNPQAYPVRFQGKGTEYFGIWIVNLCLTIVTLGIYSAWAKVRTNRYFYGNTMVDGSAFEYLASPIDILKGRVIAVLLFGGYSIVNEFYPAYASYPFLILMILLPAIIVLSMGFRMRNTGYRGLTFHFQRNFKSAYLVYGIPFILFALLFVLLALNLPETDPLTGEMIEGEQEVFAAFIMVWLLVFAGLFLMYPVWDYFQSRFMVLNTSYGASLFGFKAKIWNFVQIYLAAITIFLIGILGCLLVFSVTNGFNVDPEQGETLSDNLTSAYMLMIFPLYLYIFAYIQAYRLNTIFNASSLNGVRLESRLTASYLFYLYLSNTIAIVCSLGLLIPWAMVRTARYRAQAVTLRSPVPLNQFVKQQEQERSALGEEVGEVFDLDIGL